MTKGLFSGKIPTACVVLLVCGIVAFRGWEITRFVRMTTSSLPTIEKREGLRAFAGIAGLSQFALLEARRLPLDGRAGEDQAGDGRLRLTEELLSQAPLSSQDWFELCNRRIAAGQKLERILQALELSNLTGRNEGYIMYRRVAVGIALWDALPESGKRTTANDLAQTLSEMPGEEVLRIRQSLADQGEEMRNAFRSNLGAAGLTSEAALKRIGL
jgi:hypothetical protein